MSRSIPRSRTKQAPPADRATAQRLCERPRACEGIQASTSSRSASDISHCSLDMPSSAQMLRGWSAACRRWAAVDRLVDQGLFEQPLTTSAYRKRSFSAELTTDQELQKLTF